MTAPRILAFAGSTRQESFNKKLVRLAAEGARQAGAAVTLIDLKEYPMPVFDQDEEAALGLPANAVRLQQQLAAHDGLLIAAPEYNSSITAVLKNAIDWASRGSANQPPLAGFRGKAAVIMSASPGNLGGLRGLVHLRSILGNIGVLVLPEQLAVSKAHEAFDDAGQLKDAKQQTAVAALGAGLCQLLSKLK